MRRQTTTTAVWARLLICTLLVAIFPFSTLKTASAATTAEANKTVQGAKKEDSVEKRKAGLKSRYAISETELQAILDQGYTLDDAEAALQYRKNTKASLSDSLAKVKPRPINNAQKAKSTITSELGTTDYGSAAVSAADTIPDYNYVKTKPDQAPFTVSLEHENISTLSGDLSLQTDEFSLPGRNGMGFTLSRMYNSSDSQFGDMIVQQGVNKTVKPYEERFFPIGKGWSWNIPYLIFAGSETYIHLGDSGVYKIDANNKLIGYPWQDLSFAPSSAVVNGQTAAYVLKNTQNISQYFNSSGKLIQISDAYSNAINFTYTDSFIYGDGVTLLSSITDSVGNTIQMTYDLDSVVLTKGNQSITYSLINQNGEELLSQVVDQLGRTTTYDYSVRDAQFNLSYSTTSTPASNPYALLTGVTYPTGGKSVFTYESNPVTRTLDSGGTNQAYRIASREDQVTLSDGTTQHINHKDFTYSGDMGSTAGSIPSFSTTINDGLTQTTFTNKKNYIDTNTPAVFYNTGITQVAVQNGVTYTAQTNYTYDETNRYPYPLTTSVTKTQSDQSGSYSTTTSQAFDTYGNVTNSVDAMGGTVRNAFDGTTHLLITTAKQINGDSQWQYTQYTRNGQGTVTKIQVYAGNSAGPSGNPLSETDYENIDPATGNIGQIRVKNGSPNDTVTVVQYDSAYQYAFPTQTMTTVHNVDGAASSIVRSYSYDPTNGSLTQYTDGNGNVTSYSYDILGRVTKAVHQVDGSATSIHYDDSLNQIVSTDETGAQTETNWNPLGFKTDEGILVDGVYKSKAKYGYDAYGRLIWSEDALGNRQTFGYDAWNRQNTLAYPDLGIATTNYNDIANTMTSIDPEGYALKTVYDKLGRTVQTIETKQGGQPTTLASYTYDNAGNELTEIIAGSPQQVTSYSYDALNRLKSVTNVGGGANQTTSYNYDMLGDLTQTTFPDNQTTAKQYDEAGRLIKNTEAAVAGKNNIEKYYYDANDNQTGLIDRNGNRFKYTYNGRDFLMKKEIVDASGNPIPGEETISFSYDLLGRRLSMTDNTGTTSYAYDQATGTLSVVTFPDGSTMDYSYDSNGNRLLMRDPFGSNTYYHYDSRNRMDTVGDSLDFTNDFEAKYQYYGDDLLKQITQRNGVTSAYTYDGKQVGTLVEKKADGTTLNSFSYAYDIKGNIQSRVENGTTNSFTYDELSRIATSSQYNENYHYDSRGNRTSMTTNHPFDRPDSTTSMDKRDRLTSVTTTGGKNVTYRYNGDGLLWERTENGQTTRYYWDGDQIEAEATVSGGVASLKARYIRGQGIVARDDGQGKAYYVQNGHGDIVDLMDSTGNTKLNQYSYDIFGNIASEAENIPQPFKYSGEMQDTITGLQYLRARWYDPSIGRFMGEDTYEGQVDNPLSQNLYTYVENNPLTNIDPSGHWCTSTDGNWSHPGTTCSDSKNWDGADYLHDGDEIRSNGVTTGIYLDTDGVYEDHTWTGDVFDTVVTGGVALGNKTATTAGKKIAQMLGKKVTTAVSEEIADTLLYNGTRDATRDFLNGKGKSTLAKHFNDHKAEFGYRTEQQYLAGARNFLEKKPTATTEAFTSEGGTYFRYDTATNEFGIINQYGGISTYFKPLDNMSYWQDQIAKYAPK
ncbi:RHS repeat-associated core domain-containing protein [Paenibacillus humicola]|uniref:RHS repeat-associated core domain-containing protein n=1 Tax=Paenibacillus humicola TaxID=3110540 RepID=UPI00237B737B|nr:RHS repeat-associated core domain-containing protein [Paenibacillus humicola]